MTNQAANSTVHYLDIPEGCPREVAEMLTKGDYVLLACATFVQPQPGDRLLIREAWVYAYEAGPLLRMSGSSEFERAVKYKQGGVVSWHPPETMSDSAATERRIVSVEGPVRLAGIEQHAVWKILGHDVNPGGSPPPGTSYEQEALARAWATLYPDTPFADAWAWLCGVKGVTP